jgi:hypothetical protein
MPEMNADIHEILAGYYGLSAINSLTRLYPIATYNRINTKIILYKSLLYNSKYKFVLSWRYMHKYYIHLYCNKNKGVTNYIIFFNAPYRRESSKYICYNKSQIDITDIADIIKKKKS